MEGHRAPVEGQVRAEGRDGQHQQQRQEVNGIDLRQPIPDEPLVAGGGDAVPEHIRVVVRQDESAEDKKERSEEHTSELQSLAYLVCRLLLEKKKKKKDAVM